MKLLRGTLFWASAALALVGHTMGLWAASVGPSGYTNDFSVWPPAVDWSTYVLLGSNSAILTTADMDAAVQQLTASTISENLVIQSANPPAPSSVGSWCSSGFYIATRPSAVTANFIMCTLVNRIGTNAAGASIGFTFSEVGGLGGEEIPGFRCYYSLTGAIASWTVIPQFSSADPGNLAVTLTNLDWAEGAPLYLLWVDDNAVAVTPDDSMQIDNFFASAFASGQPAAITTQPHGGVAPTGSNITFTVGATGVPPLTYQWRSFGTDLSAATNSSLTLTNVQLANSGDYSVVVSNAFGSTTSTVARLQVYSNVGWRFASGTTNIGASFISLGTNVAVYLNGAREAYVDDVSLVPLSGPSVGVNVLQNPSFESPLGSLATNWFSVDSSTNYVITNTYSHSGTYGLHLFGVNPVTPNTVAKQSLPPLATNTYCTLSFWYRTIPNGTNLVVRLFPGALILNVSTQPTDLPPAIAAQPGNLNVSIGTQASFSVSAFGSEPLTYQWVKDGMPLADGSRFSGALTPTLNISAVQSLDAGNYSVWVTNALGFTNSAVAALIVSNNVATTPAYTLTATTGGGGSVSVSPANGPYLSNTVVTAIATPLPGWTFLQWLGEGNGLGPTNAIVMTRDKCAQAVFGTTLSAVASGDGSVLVTPVSALCPYGYVATLTAVPNAGSSFVLWGNAAGGTNNPLAFPLINANPTVSAVFGPLSAGQFALTVMAQGKGQVSVDPPGSRFGSGQGVMLTAVPGADQTFLGWSGDTNGAENPLTVSMTASKVITASFTSKPRLAVGECDGQPDREIFQLMVSGELGSRVQVEQSGDLAAWTPLGVMTNAYGTVQINDPSLTNQGQRFFRALPAPTKASPIREEVNK